MLNLHTMYHKGWMCARARCAYLVCAVLSIAPLTRPNMNGSDHLKRSTIKGSGFFKARGVTFVTCSRPPPLRMLPTPMVRDPHQRSSALSPPHQHCHPQIQKNEFVFGFLIVCASSSTIQGWQPRKCPDRRHHAAHTCKIAGPDGEDEPEFLGIPKAACRHMTPEELSDGSVSIVAGAHPRRKRAPILPSGSYLVVA